MIVTLKKFAPKGLKKFYVDKKLKYRILKDFIYDYRRFVAHSCSIILKNKEQYNAFLIKEYHAIEKALALRSPRIGFGVARVTKLINYLEDYIHKFGMDDTAKITLVTLFHYSNFEKSNQSNNPLIERISKLLTKYPIDLIDSNIGGTKVINKATISDSIDFDYNKFFKSRFSTRDFTDKKVDESIIAEAIETALYTPSVCNRQAWKVYQISNDNNKLRDKFLSVQNGNKGFGEHINSLLVVTGKMSSFFSYERNQVFVDGGMFAMSIVMALHAKGLGTCCLNTSYTAEKNDLFYNVYPIDDDCIPIMFIAVGHLKDEYKVAVSKRKGLSEILEVI